MKENYDKKMTELLKDLPKGTPLLLHSCCAPCSSACLETLKEHFELTVFYYNPNIGDEAEYLKRKAEQIRFLKETGWAKLLDCDHDAAAFIGIARGLEEEPERGRRCYRCYKLRLDAAAEAAKKNGFQWFCTTLTLSPYKNAECINAIGEEIAEQVGVPHLPNDFKKRGGYQRSIVLCREWDIYRQHYCGCIYSQREWEERCNNSQTTASLTGGE